MTVEWNRTVTEIVWESQTAPGITWTTVVGGTSSGGGVTVHNDLSGRSAADAHPMSAITDLEPALTDIATAVQAQQGDIGTLQTAVAGKQAADADLTAIAALAPADDALIQRKAGAWTSRTPAQVKADMSIGVGDVSGLDENTRDVIGAALVAGSGVAVTVDDPGNTITIAVSGVVADAINDGVTDVAPSQNAVFDALALLVPKSLVDAKGDILVATANDTVARKAVGADGTALLADSTQADGTRWGFTFIHKRTGLQASSYGMPGVTVTNYNSQTGTVGRNQLWLLPFLVLRPLQITAMARRNITAITVSDATVRCGIYATDANQAPSGAALVSTDLLFPSGTASGTTVANVVSLDLQPGLYYEAHNHTGGHDVSWAAWIVSDLIGSANGVPSAGGKAGLGSWQSLAYGALPSSPALPASMVRDDYSTFFQWSLL